MPVTYENLNETLLESFPELQRAYKYETRAGEEGPYIIYCDVMYAHVERLLDPHGERSAALRRILGFLENREKRYAALRRVFGFLETLASHEDPEVQSVVAECIVESLKSDPPRLELARPYMGPSLLAMADHHRPPWQYPKRFWSTKGRYPPDSPGT